MKRGFTLLELVIVIIIVGVLASISFTRLFKLIEYSRVTEALAQIASVHQAVERCYLMHGGAYSFCTPNVLGTETQSVPNTHFVYAIYIAGADQYILLAFRNSKDGGDTNDYIQVHYSSTGTTQCGIGAFVPLGICDNRYIGVNLL